MLGLQKINAIGRTYRDIKRYKQILQVFFSYGFGDLVRSLNIEHYLEIGLKMIHRESPLKLENLSRPERVRMALEELGPTFIKLGQIMSTRPDLIPIEYVDELAKLQDRAPSFPYSEVRATIVEDLGGAPETLFAEFAEEPFAAASVGQVHRARLPDGAEVVVKILRPNIEETVRVDLEIMMHIAGLMEAHIEALRVQKPTAVVREFARVLGKEIDYRNELFHLERFRRNFADDETIAAPRPVRELCERRVLTMEFIHGIKSSRLDLLRDGGYDLKLIARRGAEALMRQIFMHGFFHGDPHPGNLMVMPENVVCFIDFGMVGRISQEEREEFADFIIDIIGHNERRVGQSALKLVYYEGHPGDEFNRELCDLIDEHLSRPLNDIDSALFLDELINTLTKHRLRLKPNFFLMLKSLISIDHLGSRLDPSLDIFGLAEPFIRRIRFNRLNPLNLLSGAISPTVDFFRLLAEIPSDVQVLLRQWKEGTFKIEFQHCGLEPIRQTVEKASHRVSMAIVIAALIIGSALITLANVPERWHEVQMFGFTAFIAAGFIGFWVLVGMLRRQ